ncbi:hypothetical protein SLEP1_g22395 [Rubroshorea leprosula]|uniref:Uncharacterized protein n=1 Tax=Rubroshorea leprosula TaxID=152421 RepID=A0AAV5JF45_9ROSI|nr:hypothetical protein SLEP1_g22395 [Rubroshorea leprosula]
MPMALPPEPNLTSIHEHKVLSPKGRTCNPTQPNKKAPSPPGSDTHQSCPLFRQAWHLNNPLLCQRELNPQLGNLLGHDSLTQTTTPEPRSHPNTTTYETTLAPPPIKGPQRRSQSETNKRIDLAYLPSPALLSKNFSASTLHKQTREEGRRKPEATLTFRTRKRWIAMQPNKPPEE